MSDNYAELSDLERELELELEGTPNGDLEMEFETAAEDTEYRFELEQDEEVPDEFETSYELDEETPDEFELDDTDHEQMNYGDRSSEYVERLLEIGSRQFESPYEADAALGEVLDDIEREHFFGAIRNSLRKLSKNKMLRSLAKKGMTFGVNKFFPGLQGALQLARGNVKGALLNFGKQALGSVVPGGGAMLDAVKAIGLQPASGIDAQQQETWENYVNLSREAYEHLAENLTPTADRPAEAMRLANNAVQHAIARAQTRTVNSRHSGRTARHGRGHGRVLRLRVSPGERIKLIIAGA
jgi:hypothetical protein